MLSAEVDGVGDGYADIDDDGDGDMDTEEVIEGATYDGEVEGVSEAGASSTAASGCVMCVGIGDTESGTEALTDGDIELVGEMQFTPHGHCESTRAGFSGSSIGIARPTSKSFGTSMNGVRSTSSSSIDRRLTNRSRAGSSSQSTSASQSQKTKFKNGHEKIS
jgi:hypothetical protein